MAGKVYQWVVLFVICFKLSIAGLKTGLFCKDPDTGKFHAVNSSWASTTFCGNYTCKLRRKNSTDTETYPTTTILNEVDKHDKQHETNSSAIDKSISYNNIITHMLPKVNVTSTRSEEITDDGDRYLTEDEIKAISDLLHKVKKSDIDSLVEIYNLAQDIYKEMDASGAEDKRYSVDLNQKNHIPEPQAPQNIANKKGSLASYWYEPLNTLRISNDDRAESEKTDIMDMQKSSSDQVFTAQPAKETSTYFSNYVYPHEVSFYYPVSPFQRLSSYIYNPYNIPIHQPGIVNTNIQNYEEAKLADCDNNTAALNSADEAVTTPWINRIMNKPFLVEPENRIYTQGMLPYPFSLIHRNNPGYHNDLYFDGTFWNSADNRRPQYQNKLRKEANTQIFEKQNEVNNINEIVKPETFEPHAKNVVSEIENSKLLQSLMREPHSKQINQLAAWQTEPLAPHVLDEVRAHVIEKSTNMLKSNPLRKHIKLDRVSKLLRLDAVDEVNRSKRSTDVDHKENSREHQDLNDEPPDDNILEPYLIKALCESSTEPGYFSLGNSSKPFPGCCPQKIEKR